MKRTAFKRRGKAQEYWYECKQKLKQEYEERGITRCEICGTDFGLSFHHRSKRWTYIRRPEDLGKFSETILLCLICHDKLEADKELTKLWFNKLR